MLTDEMPEISSEAPGTSSTAPHALTRLSNVKIEDEGDMDPEDREEIQDTATVVSRDEIGECK